MNASARIFVGLAVGLVGSGCSDPLICDPPVPPFALYVTVRDSISARPLAIGTVGTADSSGVHDTPISFSTDSLSLYAAHNAAGVYRVMLQQPGCRPWSVDNVDVEWSRCGGGGVAVYSEA
jgi:hypothetical protein